MSSDEQNIISISIGLLYTLGEKITSSNSTKILSHHTKQWLDITRTVTLSKVWAPLNVDTFQGTLAFSQGFLPASLRLATLLHWMTPGTHFHHFGLRDLNSNSHFLAIQIMEAEANFHSHLEQKTIQSLS